MGRYLINTLCFAVSLIVFTSCTAEDAFRQFGGNSTARTQSGNDDDKASVVLSEAKIDFGSRAINSINYRAIQVTNKGKGEASDFSLAGLLPPFGVRDGNAVNGANACGTKIAPGASCTFLVTYIPENIGDDAQQLKASFKSGGVTVERPVDIKGSGNGIATLQIVDPMDLFSSATSFGAALQGSGAVVKTLLVKYGGLQTPGAIGVTFSTLRSPFSIVSTDCRAEQNRDCNLTVSYSTSVLGESQDFIEVNYNNYAYSATASRDLKGRTDAVVVPVIKRANLSLQAEAGGGPNLGFGRRLMNNSFKRKYRIANTGTDAATLTTKTISPGNFNFTGANFPGTAGTCGAVIAAGTNCLIEVEFVTGATITPAGQSVSGQLTIAYTDESGTGSLSSLLTGAVGKPALLRIQKPLGTSLTAVQDLGTTWVDYTVTAGFLLANDGDSVDAKLGALQFSKSQFSVSKGSCGSTLSANGACQINVSFTPDDANPSSTKDFFDTLRVNFTDNEVLGNSVTPAPATLDFSGKGRPEALLVVQGSLDNFWTNIPVNTSSTKRFTIRRYGLLDATNIVSSGLSDPITGAAFSGGALCGTTLTRANPTCELEVTFAPRAAGTFVRTLAVNYFNGLASSPNPISQRISGTAIIQTSQLAFADPSVNYGNTAGPATRTLNITKSGPIDLTGVTFTTSAPYSITRNGCSGTITTSCSIDVVFQPTTGGAFNDVNLVMTYSDGAVNQTRTIKLSGTNLAVLSFNTFADFGKAAINTSSTRVLRLTNTGSQMATGVMLCPSPQVSAPFSIVANGCSNAIGPGAFCEVTLQFNSPVPGTKNGELCFNYQSGVGSALTVKANLQGSGTVGRKVFAGGNFTCSLSDLGNFYCFGNNSQGQLGMGDLTARGLNSGAMGPSLPKVPLTLAANVYIKDAALGNSHACVLLSDGGVRCWGSNHFGQLGLGDITGAKMAIGDQFNEVSQLTNIDLGGQKAISIAAGFAHTCAITEAGSVLCWGENSYGKLGRGDTKNIGVAPGEMGTGLMAVPLGKPAVQLALDTGHSCARLNDGSLKCWGYNNWGQLGQQNQVTIGDEANEVAGLAAINLGLPNGVTLSQVATGGAYTATVDSSGKVRMFGHNFQGVLGIQWCAAGNLVFGSCTLPGYSIELPGYGDQSRQMGAALPAVSLGNSFSVAGLSLVTGNKFTCAMAGALPSRQIKCWGTNESGQLGQGHMTNVGADPADMGDALDPVDLGSLVPASMAAGDAHACILTTGGEIYCWGNNQYGQLGTGMAGNVGDQAGEMGSGLDRALVP